MTNVLPLFLDPSSDQIQVGELNADEMSEKLLRTSTKWLMRTRKSSGSFLALSSSIKHGYIISCIVDDKCTPVFVKEESRASKFIIDKLDVIYPWVAGAHCPVALNVSGRPSLINLQIVYIPIPELDEDVGAWLFVE